MLGLYGRDLAFHRTEVPMNLSIPVQELLKSIPGVFGIHFDDRPHYEVLERGELELRKYPEITLVSRRETGRHEWAINKAFTHLAKFIFSNDIAMTIPVFQEKHTDGVTLSFFIPNSVVLPKVPEGISLRTIPERTVAVYSYSGFNVPTAMDEAREELENLLTERDDLAVIGDTFYAQYDAPSTIPFLRRNEAMVEVKLLHGN